MEYQITKSNEVGKADHGWLKAKHYFSFANYYNPEKMGFGKLRVINDDLVQVSSGFGTHPHKDMEIITIPLEGAVTHEDSKGNKGIVQRGEVQVMSAGKGILHSEHNQSDTTDLKLFQIWIEPNQLRVEPRYDQARFDYQNKRNQWTQLISPISEKAEEGLKIYQTAYINGTLIDANKSLKYKIKHPGENGVYILLTQGDVDIESINLKTRDSLALTDIGEFEIKANSNSELLVIEVPLTP
jgi:quercetin 2,3-dioxygenase